MLKETFGEMLYVSESEHMAEFPSPDELKGKIVISTKAPKECFQTKSSKDAAATEEEEGVWGEEISDDKATARQARPRSPPTATLCLHLHACCSTKAPKEYFQTKSSKDAAATEEEEGVWGEEITDDKATARQARPRSPPTATLCLHLHLHLHACCCCCPRHSSSQLASKQGSVVGAHR
jgi:hypothetical protein